MDPTRWSQGEISDVERQLLEAARQDRIPSALGARMAEGLGVQFASVGLEAGGQAGAQGGGGLAAGGKLGAPLFAKTGLWGVLSIALAAAVASWYTARIAPTSRASRPPAARVASSQPAAPVPIVAPAAVVAPANEAAAPAHVAVTPAVRARPAAVDDDAALRAETALLDRARTALHGGASAEALRALDQYRRRFAHGRLAPEAAALRIEALVQGGSHDEAETMSRRFVSAYPSHPLTERVLKLSTARAPSGSR